MLEYKDLQIATHRKPKNMPSQAPKDITLYMELNEHFVGGILVSH